MSKRSSNARGRMVTTTNNNSRRTPRGASRSNRFEADQGIMPISRFPGSNPSIPGEALVRVAVPAIVTTPGNFVLNISASPIGSSVAFASWFPQADRILSNFAFFRVRHLSITPIVSGGAASPYSIAFNVSNNYGVDSGVIDILDDDYAAMATALHLPVLAPPRQYWDNGSRKWYNTIGISAGLPDVSAGSINVQCSGAAVDTTVGWLMIQMEMEYHTLR